VAVVTVGGFVAARVMRNRNGYGRNVYDRRAAPPPPRRAGRAAKSAAIAGLVARAMRFGMSPQARVVMNLFAKRRARR
jgi:hypothetical protein